MWVAGGSALTVVGAAAPRGSAPFRSAQGNVLGVGNRPRQGRAVLEILALLYVLRRLGAGSAAADLRQIGAEACSQSDGAVSPSNGTNGARNNSRRPSLASISSSSGSTLTTSDGDAIPATSGSLRADTILARWNAWLRRFNPLQVVLSVLIAVHLWNNASLLLGLNAPHYSMTQEPDMVRCNATTNAHGNRAVGLLLAHSSHN